jgi:hypothetical protein
MTNTDAAAAEAQPAFGSRKHTCGESRSYPAHHSWVSEFHGRQLPETAQDHKGQKCALLSAFEIGIYMARDYLIWKLYFYTRTQDRLPTIVGSVLRFT